MRARERETLVGRAEMAGIGALAGLAIWGLVEKAGEVLTQPLLYLLVIGGVAGFFAVLLALAGPATLRRAALGAALLALPAAGLLAWSSLRFDSVPAFYEAGHPIAAWGVLLFIGTPFLGVWLDAPEEVRNYARLFDAAWGIVVRYSAAWLFVGLFWVVLFLSDALLKIVGLSVIEDLIDVDGVPFGLTGLVLGLALAVVHELREYVSPYLVLRLLRLLVPVALVVGVVFSLALIMRGTGDLFGDLSPAATLMAVALGMVSLVSVALDKRDEDAVRAGWMRGATAALALLVPVMAGLAAYAVWLRVGQYGWTPQRVAAALVAAVVTLYALAYAVSVVMRGAWMARIRQANIGIAGGILLASVLWLTPVLNAEAISARSQVARVLAGRATADQAAVWELAHEWGRPGRAGLAELAALEGDAHAALRAAIADVDKAETRHAFAARTERGESADRAEALAGLLKSLPGSLAVTGEMLTGLPDYRLKDWLVLCRDRPEPGCVIVLDEFDGDPATPEALVFLPRQGARYEVISLSMVQGRLRMDRVIRDRHAEEIGAGEVRRLLAGEGRMAPSSRRSLWLGEIELTPTR